MRKVAGPSPWGTGRPGGAVGLCCRVQPSPEQGCPVLALGSCVQGQGGPRLPRGAHCGPLGVSGHPLIASAPSLPLVTSSSGHKCEVRARCRGPQAVEHVPQESEGHTRGGPLWTPLGLWLLPSGAQQHRPAGARQGCPPGGGRATGLPGRHPALRRRLAWR